MKIGKTPTSTAPGTIKKAHFRTVSSCLQCYSLHSTVSTVPDAEVTRVSPPTAGIESPLGGGQVNLHEGVVEGELQEDCSGEEESIWGSQDIVEEWLGKTQYLWDRPTLEEGSWVKVVDMNVC